MARDPGSKWAPLPEAGAPDGYAKTQFIVHSTGDNASADRIRNYFANIGVVVESTFIVGVTSDDPTLQIMDSTDNADANVSSNQRAIAVEVVGDGTGPFTEWQVAEIIRLGRWAAATHPIALRVCPSSTESGFGWHIMFGSPGPWTTVRKICPGPVRITQLQTRIFPAIFAGAPAPTPTPVIPLEDEPMFIRNEKGTVALLGGTYVVAIDPKTWAGAEAAGHKYVQCSNAKFDELVKAATSLSRVEVALGHVDKVLGDHAVREKAKTIEALLAGLKTTLPPVDVKALAVEIAGLINKD